MRGRCPHSSTGLQPASTRGCSCSCAADAWADARLLRLVPVHARRPAADLRAVARPRGGASSRARGYRKENRPWKATEACGAGHGRLAEQATEAAERTCGFSEEYRGVAALASSVIASAPAREKLLSARNASEAPKFWRCGRGLSTRPDASLRPDGQLRRHPDGRVEQVPDGDRVLAWR